MPGSTLDSSLADDLRTDFKHLDTGCHRALGVSGVVFRTAKFLFYISTLVFTGYLIEIADVEPFLAMLFAAALITGPEGLEAWLVRQGVLADTSDGEDNS